MNYININNVKLTWYGHASFSLEYNTKIFIDPYELDTEEKADIILITHGHYDHCSIPDIQKIIKDDTLIITTPDTVSKLASKITQGKTKLVKPGEKFNIENIQIETVPAYNIDKDFHPKDNDWVGYKVTVNNVSFYHTGDTDLIPEMKNIEANVLLCPVGGTYTMDASQAAKLANNLKCKLAIPMHYGKIVGTLADAERFKKLCSCEVRIL